MWNGQKWSYSTTFPSPATALSSHHGTPSTTLLVFEGVKMGASVVLNGVVLGNTTDQFVRYSFPVPTSLLQTDDQGALPSIDIILALFPALASTNAVVTVPHPVLFIN